NGVDERFLEVTPDPAASRTVLFVGRLCPEKGIHVLLSAMNDVSRTHPQASLSLVGPLDVAPKDFVDPHSRDPIFNGLDRYYSRPTPTTSSSADWQARSAGAHSSTAARQT